jgi:pimeloyl-ACP methyl ester carboxylesterase
MRMTRFLAAAVSAALVVGAGALALASGGLLAAEERGSGTPAIVLVHSIGGSRSDWSAVAPLLAARHRVILVDLPGHGQSPPPTGAPTVREASAALARTLEKLKVERAVLVGHSYGALVALRTAIDRPRSAAAVVVVDAASFTPADSERIASAEKVMSERYPVFVNAVFGGMSNDGARGDSLVAHATLVPKEVLTGYFRDSWREDLRPGLRSLKAPLHVVATKMSWPEEESWTSARRRLGYETAGPAVGHRVLESGHMVPLDQPDSLAAVILGAARRP